jgi:hypothetical protein
MWTSRSQVGQRRLQPMTSDDGIEAAWDALHAATPAGSAPSPARRSGARLAEVGTDETGGGAVRVSGHDLE